MCKVCDKIELLDQDTALQVVGDAMKRYPKLMDHLSEVLDKILEIEKPQINPELDNIWERGRR